MKPNAYVTNIRDQRELRNKASLAHQILQISCPMGPHISDLFQKAQPRFMIRGGPIYQGVNGTIH